MTPEEILERIFSADVAKNDWHCSAIVAMKEFAKQERKKAFEACTETVENPAFNGEKENGKYEPRYIKKYNGYTDFAAKNPLN